jgi:hypothetical protein
MLQSNVSFGRRLTRATALKLVKPSFVWPGCYGDPFGPALYASVLS